MWLGQSRWESARGPSMARAIPMGICQGRSGAIPEGICRGYSGWFWGNPGGTLPGVRLGGFGAIPEGICQVYGRVKGRMITAQGA